VSRRVARFWGSAAASALLFGLAAALFMPYGALGIEEGAERTRSWLLTLWTGGVMAILFGASALVGVLAPVGFREVHEAGSLTQAVEARRRARLARPGFHGNFAWWLVCTGAILIALYFVAWAAGPRLTL
jgi:hypothetical protein